MVGHLDAAAGRVLQPEDVVLIVEPEAIPARRGERVALHGRAHDARIVGAGAPVQAAEHDPLRRVAGDEQDEDEVVHVGQCHETLARTRGDADDLHPGRLHVTQGAERDLDPSERVGVLDPDHTPEDDGRSRRWLVARGRCGRGELDQVAATRVDRVDRFRDDVAAAERLLDAADVDRSRPA